MNEPDTWICRIPRAQLLALAANPGLAQSARVLAAMLSELYERLDATGGESDPSQRELARITGLSRRTVRDVLDRWVGAAALVAESNPGHATRYRVASGRITRPPNSGRITRPPHAENTPTSGQGDTPTGGRISAPTREEGRREELFEEARAVETADNGPLREPLSEHLAKYRAGQQRAKGR